MKLTGNPSKEYVQVSAEKLLAYFIKRESLTMRQIIIKKKKASILL